MRFVNNSELDDRDRERQRAQEEQNSAKILNIAAHIRQAWQRAKYAKEDLDNAMLKSLRQRNGEYDADIRQALAELGMSEEYIQLTDVKCRHGLAQLKEILMPANGKPWAIEPTPVADLPEPIIQRVVEQTMAVYLSGQVGIDQISDLAAAMRDEIQTQMQEEAKQRAERMEEKIEDQLFEGNFRSALGDVLNDLLTYQAGILKGPVIRRRPKLQWENGFDLTIGEELRPEYERVSPFDLYPAPDATTVDDSYVIEKLRLTPRYLEACKGAPGFHKGAIDLVLAEYGTAGLREYGNIDYERSRLESRTYERVLGGAGSHVIEGFEYWGPVQGWMLEEWGYPVDDRVKFYDVQAWLIGQYVVMAVMNPHPLNERPYGVTSYDKIPGSFWGKGIPQLMRSVQNICNSTVRALLNNMAAASGPQTILEDMERLAPGTDVETWTPWKIWLFEGDPVSRRAPLSFFQPDIRGDELIRIYDRFSREADEVTGIAGYSYGNPDPNRATDTASGLSMLLNSANRSIREVIRNVDHDIVERMIRHTYIYNMIYGGDASLKGDAKIRALGAATLVQKEQVERQRLLFLQQTNNPVDLGIMGVERRANVLREASENLDMPSGDVVPSKDEFRQEQAAQQAAMAEQEAAAAALPPATNVA